MGRPACNPAGNNQSVHNPACDPRARFLDDFDTPNAVKALQKLVDSTGSYLSTLEASNSQPSSLALCAAARYVAETWLKLGVQGLCSDEVLDALRVSGVEGNTKHSNPARTASSPHRVRM